MGSYKSTGYVLPFLTRDERAREEEIVTRIFEKWKTTAEDKTALRGVPLYVAFMHTGKGSKILENNSRPGDPEIINVLPIMKDDLVDVCYRILEGNLTHIALEEAATVVTYEAPPNYGGYADAFPSLVNPEEVDKPVDLKKAYALSKKYGDKIRVYPGSMELRGNENFALKSRAVCVVGVGEDIQAARQISLEGVAAIKGGALWHRTDVASEQHIESSIKHMDALRREK
jgi:phosphoribosylamine--glycine ligase